MIVPKTLYSPRHLITLIFLLNGVVIHVPVMPNSMRSVILCTVENKLFVEMRFGAGCHFVICDGFHM